MPKRKALKINPRLLNIIDNQLPPDYVTENYSYPETLGKPDKATRLALDSAIRPSHRMIEMSLSKCGMGDMLPKFLGYGVLIALSQNSKIRAGIEMIANEMAREWIKFNRLGDKDENDNGIPDLVEDFKKFGVQEHFRKATATAGYFGGCLLFIDTGEPMKDLVNPLVLKEKVFAKDSLKGFKLIEPYNVSPGRYNSNRPLKQDYFKPKTWFVQGLPVHESRFLYFTMTEVTSMLLPAYNFFGIPLAQIVLDSVMHFTECREAVARLLTKYSMTVLQTNMEEILSGGASTMIDRRVQYMVQNRSNDGIEVIDKDLENIINVSTPLSGITDIVRQAMEFVAADFNEPATKMWGISPAGMNATGESDMRNHRDNINTLQEKMYTCPIRTIITLLQLNRSGHIDESVGFTYNKLSEDDEQKKAAVQKTKADTAAVLIDAGVIGPEEERRRIANDPDSGYDGIDPYDLPETSEEEMDDARDVTDSEHEEMVNTLGQDAADDEGWITMNGCRVKLDENGTIIAGAGGKFNGKKVSDIKKSTQQNAKNATSQYKTKADAIGSNTFSQGFSKRNLDIHYSQHKEEFPGLTKTQYAEKAKALIEQPVGGDILGHVKANGRLVRFDSRDDTYVSGHPDVGIATMMKLNGGKERFEKLMKRDS